MIIYRYIHKPLSVLFVILLSNCVYAASGLQLEYSARLGQIGTDNDSVYFAVFGRGERAERTALYKQGKDESIIRLKALPDPVMLPNPRAVVLDSAFHYSALLTRPTSSSYDADHALFSIKIDKDTQTQTVEVLPKTLSIIVFPLVLKDKVLWLGLSKGDNNKQILVIIEVDANGKMIRTTKTNLSFDEFWTAVKLTDNRICIAVYSQENLEQTQLLVLDENLKVIGKTFIDGAVVSLSADSEVIGAIAYEQKDENNGNYRLSIYDNKLTFKAKIDLPLSLHLEHSVRSQLIKGKFFIAGTRRPYESLWVDRQGKIEGQKNWIPKNDADTFLDVVPAIGKLSDGVALIYGKPNDRAGKFDITIQRFAVP